MGRPKGSKNKTAEERRMIEQEKQERRERSQGKRGRPVGSKNKPKVVHISTKGLLEETADVVRTGRPKGSKSGYTVSEKALAQRKKNASERLLKVATTDGDKDYNTRLIEHIMRVNEISLNADRHDLVSLRSCFIAYLRLCQEDGFSVGNLAAYRAMGMDGPSFGQFARKDDPEIREFVKFVKGTCAMFREAAVDANKLNPVIGIFWQRNYDGLRNDTEQVQAIQEQEDDTYGSNGSYKDKYKKLIGG